MLMGCLWDWSDQIQSDAKRPEISQCVFSSCERCQAHFSPVYLHAVQWKEFTGRVDENLNKDYTHCNILNSLQIIWPTFTLH